MSKLQGLGSGSQVPELSAHNLCICLVPNVVADSPPLSLDQDLHTSLILH